MGVSARGIHPGLNRAATQKKTAQPLGAAPREKSVRRQKRMTKSKV